MIAKVFAAFCLIALTVTIHATGLGLLFRGLHWKTLPKSRFWPITWLLIRIAWWLILLHMVEISVWALFFWWQNCLPNVLSSFYFSGVTYTTVGYGDLLLPYGWKLFGPIEALTGILMCGLSTAYFFAVVTRRLLQGTNTRSQA
jgi:hypothetical protein